MLKRLRKNEWVRTFVGACLYYSGLTPYIRWRGQQQPRRLVIMTYHRANGAGLRGQLSYLKRHYRVLPLEDALAELYAPDPAPPPADSRPMLAVTLDDGYQDNYTHLFPLACELGIPFTIFLVPGYLDSGDVFWWLAGKTFVRQTQRSLVTLDGRSFDLSDGAQRKALERCIDTNLRYTPSVAKREAKLAEARQALGLTTGATNDDDADRAALPLTWEQVAEMAASGWVTFGAHTQHHPVLACLRDPAEVAREVGDCREALESRLGRPVRTFAYPIGHAEAIGSVAPEAAKRARYQWIASNQPGANTPATDPTYLLRIGAETSDHWLILAARAAGVSVPGLIFAPESNTNLAGRVEVEQTSKVADRDAQKVRGEASGAAGAEEDEAVGHVAHSPSR